MEGGQLPPQLSKTHRSRRLDGTAKVLQMVSDMDKRPKSLAQERTRSAASAWKHS